MCKQGNGALTHSILHARGHQYGCGFQHRFEVTAPSLQVSLRASMDGWSLHDPMEILDDPPKTSDKSTAPDPHPFRLERMLPPCGIEYHFVLGSSQHYTDPACVTRLSQQDNSVRPSSAPKQVSGSRPMVHAIPPTVPLDLVSFASGAALQVLPRASAFGHFSQQTAWSLPISVFAGYVAAL